jgi:serine phosphatase RsbU (regulator of sigma subunit)
MARRWSSPTARGWTIAIVVPAVVALAVPQDGTPTNVPGGLMLLGVVFATGLGGLAAGLCGAVLAVTVLDYFFLEPIEGFVPTTAGSAVGVVVYAGVAGVIAVSTDRLLRRARTETARATELHVELESERAALVAVQQALLPRNPPVGPGFTVSFRYRAADEVAAVGGDWYAVVPLDDGRLGLAIGDVVGHGLESIALMAEIRFALRTLASEGAEPREVLQTLNRLVHIFDAEAMCTALYGIWDPTGGHWRQAVAGHLPPVLRHAAGCGLVETRPGLPLGVTGTPSYETTGVAMDGSATLVLYTDGLIERRDESLDVSLDRLCSAMRSAPPHADDVCDDLMRQFVPASAADDVAIVVAQVEDGVARGTIAARPGL